MKAAIRESVAAAVSAVEGVGSVEVTLSARPGAGAPRRTALPGVRAVVAVGAGKGGVGKSTVAVNLAVALAREGAAVGLLDADVFGPSIATMLGVEGIPPRMADGRIQPYEAFGIKAISMANFARPGQAMVWRGPMVHQGIMQLLTEVQWGPLDYLIVDLPPGTGDVPLSLAQAVPVTGAVVVSTPQPLAVADAVRAAQMYRQLNIEVLGMVENMSGFICDGCGKRHELFSRGGAAEAAEKLGVPLLGELPICPALREHTDAGHVDANFAPDAPAAEAFTHIARGVMREVCARSVGGEEAASLS